jgi:hypothetical protein
MVNISRTSNHSTHAHYMRDNDCCKSLGAGIEQSLTLNTQLNSMGLSRSKLFKSLRICITTCGQPWRNEPRIKLGASFKKCSCLNDTTKGSLRNTSFPIPRYEHNAQQSGRLQTPDSQDIRLNGQDYSRKILTFSGLDVTHIREVVDLDSQREIRG